VGPAGVKNMLAGEQQAAVTVAVEGLMEARPVPELEAFATYDPKVCFKFLPPGGLGSAKVPIDMLWWTVHSGVSQLRLLGVSWKGGGGGCDASLLILNGTLDQSATILRMQQVKHSMNSP